MTETKSRGKVRAFLAGGLVLGLGAAVTLAAWNDSEFAEGLFQAGSFNLEGSVDGASFTENDTAGDPASLEFEFNPDNLAPGDVVHAPFSVRLDDSTSNDANVVVGSDSSTGALTGLTYQLFTTETLGCGADSTGTDLVAVGTPLGTTPAEVNFDLVQGVAGAAGEQVNLCFRVTATDDLAQGQVGATVWSFAAESQ